MAKRKEENTAPAPAPAPATEQKVKGKRGHLSAESKARGKESRNMRTKVNEYLLMLKRPVTEGKRTESRAERIAEIDKILAAGVMPKAIPIFEVSDNPNGGKKIRKRVETHYEDRPLDPIKIVELTAERARLTAIPVPKNLAELRAEVIAFLPEFCNRNGFGRNDLLAAGFPEKDLEEAKV